MNAKQWTPNLHAHVVFDWTQPNGKSVRLSRDDMAELQTIASETLGMERGVSSDRKHLSAMQYKTECAKEQLQELSNLSLIHIWLSPAVIDCHKNVNLWEQQVFMYKQ